MIAIIESETADACGDLIGILVYLADLLNLLIKYYSSFSLIFIQYSNNNFAN